MKKASTALLVSLMTATALDGIDGGRASDDAVTELEPSDAARS